MSQVQGVETWVWTHLHTQVVAAQFIGRAETRYLPNSVLSRRSSLHFLVFE